MKFTVKPSGSFACSVVNNVLKHQVCLFAGAMNSHKRLDDSMRWTAVGRLEAEQSQTKRNKKLKRLIAVENPLLQRTLGNKLQVSQLTICHQVNKTGNKKVKKPVCIQVSVKTIEKRRKRSLPLYLTFKGRYKEWMTSNEALFHLSSTTGETKPPCISSEKRCRDATVLQNAIWPSGVMVWMGMSSQGLTKPFFVEPKAKIDAKYYQNKVLKHIIKKSKHLYP
ncbi:uncharacterized protein TNCV_530181 [Trichonephila clavipes]|nr:uncharacterized protein TNCV_530181 [Trichonephila clavipes]